MYTQKQQRISLCQTSLQEGDKWKSRNGIYFEDCKNSGTGGFLFYENGEFWLGNGTLQNFPKYIQVDRQRGIVIGSKVKQELPGSVIIGDDSGENLNFGTDLLLMGRNVGREITETNNVIAMGANAMKKASAIGDSIAMGTDAMGECEVCELNLAHGMKSLYRVAGNYNIGIGIRTGENLDSVLSTSNSLLGREVLRDCKGTFIDILAMGTKAGEHLEGNHFHSFYAGDFAAAQMKAKIASTHNVGIGSHVLENATDVSESVVMGCFAGNHGAGVRALVMGPRAGHSTSGSWQGDILLGDRAGAFRHFFESNEVIIGSEAGMSGSGVFNNLIGKLAGAGLVGANNNVMGANGGFNLVGDDNIAFGPFAGAEMTGCGNLVCGKGQGRGLIGNFNILLGEGPEICEKLSHTIGIGQKLRLRGKNGIAIGNGVFSGAQGELNGDLAMGQFAGQNQNLLEEERNLLLVGNYAGAAYPNIPGGVNSYDVAIFGHEAGRTENQIFQSAALFGNKAGSFASRIIRSMIAGPGAGIGMDGEDCTYLGYHAGFNVKGDRNILVGNLGEQNPVLNDTFAVGVEKAVIQADLQKGNVLVGKDKIRSNWSDGENGLALMEGKAPRNVDSDLVVLTLESEKIYATSKERKTVLNYPYRFVYNGEVTALKYLLNTTFDGTTCISYKFIPHSKLDYFATGELLLHIEKGVISVSPLVNPKWKLEFSNNIMILSAVGVGKAIVYFEVIGEHLMKRIED